LETALSEFNPEKPPLFEAKSFYIYQGSRNFAEKVIFKEILATPPLAIYDEPQASTVR